MKFFKFLKNSKFWKVSNALVSSLLLIIASLLTMALMPLVVLGLICGSYWILKRARENERRIYVVMSDLPPDTPIENIRGIKTKTDISYFLLPDLGYGEWINDKDWETYVESHKSKEDIIIN